MIPVPVSVLGPSANPNFLRARVLRPDLTWKDILVLKALVQDGFTPSSNFIAGQTCANLSGNFNRAPAGYFGQGAITV